MANADQLFIQRSARWVIVGAVTLAVALGALWLLKGALTPLVIAFVLAYFLDPLIDVFEARRVPRAVAILLLIALALSAIAVLGVFLIPLLQRELSEVSVRMPEYVSGVPERLNPLLQRFFGVELPGTLSEGFTRLQEQLGGAQAIGTLGGVVGGAAGFFAGTIQAVVGLLIIPVIAFYLLAEFDDIKRRIALLIPRAYVDDVVQRAETIDRLIAGFVRGQLTVCGLLGVLYAVGFAVIGVDMAALIGVFSGLLALIPYVGGVCALVSAVTLCVLEFGLDVHVALVVGWYGAVQLFESFVLTPKIVGESLGLHPITVIVALMIGGDLLGFVGLLVAVPIAAIVQVFAGELVSAYRASALYGAS